MSILVVIERIYRYQFKSICLRNHNFFAIFFYKFLNLHKIMGQVFDKLLTVEGVLIQMNKRACF